eukprot:1186065-Prorocentrum_minimum.AAC.1
MNQANDTEIKRRRLLTAIFVATAVGATVAHITVKDGLTAVMGRAGRNVFQRLKRGFKAALGDAMSGDIAQAQLTSSANISSALHKALSADVSASNDDELCITCVSAQKEVALVPCGHRTMCERCTLVTLSMTHTDNIRCPLCRCEVERYLKIID